MDLDYDDTLCEHHVVRLPDLFWHALKEVRDYWIQNEWFQDVLYHPRLGDKSMRIAFDFFDSYLSAILDHFDQETM